MEKGYCSMAFEDFKEDAVPVHPTSFPDIIGKQGVTIKAASERGARLPLRGISLELGVEEQNGACSFGGGALPSKSNPSAAWGTLGGFQDGAERGGEDSGGRSWNRITDAREVAGPSWLSEKHGELCKGQPFFGGTIQRKYRGRPDQFRLVVDFDQQGFEELL